MNAISPERKSWGFTYPILRSSEIQAYFAVANVHGSSSIHFHSD